MSENRTLGEQSSILDIFCYEQTFYILVNRVHIAHLELPILVQDIWAQIQERTIER